MAFNWQKRHFKTVAEFEAYVKTLSKPSWLSGLTIHHTWKPTVETWRGSSSMDALERYYRSLGWSAGPHLFIGPDGIFQGTPITDIGVHAGPCNSSRLGIEVVGDYDNEHWSDTTRAQVIGVLVALVRSWGLSIDSINGHRDCMPGSKSCPGNAIYMTTVRVWTRAALEAPQSIVVKADRQVIGVKPSITPAQWEAAVITRNKAQISKTEAERVYEFCVWLDIDPAFVLALWVHESGRPLGLSDLQRQSHSALNLKAAPGEWRPTVEYKGEKWHAFESYQLGLYAGIIHLKNVYGAKGLLTVRQIIPVFAPATDGNDVEAYIKSVMDDMAYMRAH